MKLTAKEAAQVIAARKQAVKPMEPYTLQWQREANALARSYVRIVACKLCGHPRHNDYICPTCGKDDDAED